MKAFAGAVERHAQPVHQVDDFRSPVGHFLDGRLVIQKVTAVNRIVEVLPLVVAQLSRLIVAAVDPALCTNAVRAFDRSQADQVDVDTQLGQLHCRCQSGQAAADHHDSMLCHESFRCLFLSVVAGFSREMSFQ